MEDDTSTPNLSLCRESQAVEEDFINTYRSLPELWDTRHSNYTNKYKRNAALDKLLQIMKRSNPSATRYNVRRKINIMRSGYRKDLRKHLASKCIGPNGEEVYEHTPKNWKFHALRFLEKDSENNEIVEINLNYTNFEDEASDVSTSGNDDEPTPHTSDVLAEDPQPAPTKQGYTRKHAIKRLKVEKDEYYPENNLLDRELDAIGANVTCKLKRMNPQQRYHAELLLNKVLITGLKNNLTEDTDITDVYRS